MEWIKAKYDRLLLGVLGVVSLLVGGMLLMKVLGFNKENFPPRPEPTLRSDFGASESTAKLEAAKTSLATERVIKPPVSNGKDVSLFNSSPILKTADQKFIDVLSPDSEPLRPPIPNHWFYNNDLPLPRTDVADMDPDGDGFTNGEEYAGKTNPRDKANAPPLWVKIVYKESIEDPLTLKFAIDGGDREITIRHTEPVATAFNSLIAVGDSFPAVRGGTEMRFKLTKVERTGPKATAHLEDLLTKQKFTIELNEVHRMPTLRAKLECTLGTPEEKIVSKDEEFSFEVNPDYKLKVLEITPEEVKLEAPNEKNPVSIKIK
jgi:hypothetical protein